MDDNVVRLCVNGRKIEPGMNAQLYTLRDVTRLPTGGWTNFLRSTGCATYRSQLDAEGDDRQSMSSAFPRLQLAKRLKTRASPACRSPNRSGPSGFASYPIEGMPMLVPEAHPYGGGTWAFYVIAPL